MYALQGERAKRLFMVQTQVDMERVAICITTRNRSKSFVECIRHWDGMLPAIQGEARIFVIDDASDLAYCYADHRFDERVGIPRAKNKCLELAMDWDADHVFLADDDVYPLCDDAINPYIESGANHLCYTFMPHYAVDGQFKIHVLGNGCMMYFTREAIETVGGFDTAYGIGKYEHVDLSRRIHNAGLTPHRFMDVIGGDKLFHAMDERHEIERTLTPAEIRQQLKQGRRHFNANEKSTQYIEYRETVNQIA